MSGSDEGPLSLVSLPCFSRTTCVILPTFLALFLPRMCVPSMYLVGTNTSSLPFSFVATQKSELHV